MNSNLSSRLQYFVIITGQKQKNKYVSLLVEHDGQGIETKLGKGSVNAGLLATAFGFDVEEGKAMISCLIPSEQAVKLIQTLYNDYGFSKPNTGIAFTIPVEGLAF